ncbi:MAG: hypothetical protein Q8O90_09450, partial [Elusimicrobiota bacterium]|nr:hypothetical protein [Elusimicrobiota bacterium]
MFNIKKTILIPAALAVALCAPGANAQTPPYGLVTFPLAGGPTVYLTNTPALWQNDEWNLESNIAKDGLGDIYIAGTFSSGIDTELYVKKVNPLTGVEIWTSTVANTGYDYGRGAAMDGLGNLYVLAMMQVSSITNIAVTKFNPANGQQVWSRLFDSGFGNSAYDIVADASGAYVAGATNGKIAIIRFPADGVSPITSVNFNGGFSGTAYSLAFSSGTQIVAAGALDEGNTYGNEIWLGKFNKSDLSFVWASTYAPAANHMAWGYDEAHAVKTDAAGNIYAAGFYQSQDSGQDIWLGKYDPSGNLIYSRTKNGPSNGYDKGFGLALDPLGNVYVTGKLEAYTLNQESNLWLGKYSPSGSLVSEVVAHKGSELGFDVEVSSWIVSVGGGFQDQHGLLTVSPEQFGAPQQLFAGPGQYTGSVNLSWVFETAGTFDYKIQYSTYNGGFILANAQMSKTGVAAAAGDTRNHAVMGLPTIVGSPTDGGVMGGIAGPVYYFKVWTSSDAGATWTALTNVGNTAPYAPYNYWMQTSRGQDSFFVFNSARVPAAGMARDVAGNTFIAYAAGNSGMMQGLALSKINQNGAVEWTSFYNSTSTNGRFSANNMALDAGGNIYVVGTAFFEGSLTGEDAWLAKFNGAGARLWDNIIVGPVAAANDQFTGMAIDSLGNVFAAGSLSAGAGKDIDMLIVKYSPAGALISSATFNEGPQAASPTEIRGLALDGSGNIYAGGYISLANGTTTYDRDAVVVNLNSSLVFISSHTFANANPPPANTETFDGITGLAFDGGFLYASGIKSNISLPEFWAARLNPSNWAAQVWESTHSVDGLPAAAYGLRINSGSLYISGFETRYYPPDGNKNMLLRKYDMSTGAVAWTKSVDGAYQNEGTKAVGFEVGADGYFY